MLPWKQEEIHMWKKELTTLVTNNDRVYEKYKDVTACENPVASIFDDILIQAGWYSIAYGLDLFRQYPYLAAAIRKARIRTGSDVWFPCQILTKIYACFA